MGNWSLFKVFPMARISPLSASETSPAVKAAFTRHAEEYNARITNMKSTLGHSIVAFEVYMQWYPLYEQVIGLPAVFYVLSQAHYRLGREAGAAPIVAFPAKHH
jgi:hypothetical protein